MLKQHCNKPSLEREGGGGGGGGGGLCRLISIGVPMSNIRPSNLKHGNPYIWERRSLH